MGELLEQFLVEASDLVAQAHADLARLAEDARDVGAIDGAFRAVHTLKGSVAIFDMAASGRVLHAAEDLLEQARKTGAGLTPAERAALVACVDQTDRWIEEVGRHGRLSAAAEGIAAELLATLGRAEREAEQPGWLEGVQARHEAVLRTAEGALTLFRYTPDADCFFRGDDPLAIVASVPDLLALSIIPAPGWPPPLPELEPFRCGVVLEGISRAAADSVRAAFRLVPDQVTLASLEGSAEDARANGAPAPTSGTLRVSGARLDALADGVGALVASVHGLHEVAERAQSLDPALASAIRTLRAGIEHAVASVHESVTALRLVPLAPVLQRFPRLVRETARALGKSVRLEIRGEGLDVDKQIAEGLFEPLLHLLRNGVDHGLETEGARRAAGKPAEGRLCIAATRQGDEVVIEVQDDGRGIDPARVRARAVERGLIGAEAAEALSEAETVRLIFLPGFSTSAAVSDLSGRGVGLDAVQAAMTRVRGRVAVQSEAGRGTRFQLRFPANAITTPLLIVRAGDDSYGVPLDHVLETVRLDAGQIMPVGAGRACVLHGRTVPVLDLADLLGGTERPSDTATLLITRAGGEQVAMRVDAFGTRMDAQVRPKRGLLRAVPGVSGTTVLPDGRVLLVLDLPGLAA